MAVVQKYPNMAFLGFCTMHCNNGLGICSVFWYLDPWGRSCVLPASSKVHGKAVGGAGEASSATVDAVKVCRTLDTTNLKIMTVLESQWLRILGYFKPLMVYFGVERPVISSYLAVQGVV